MYFIPLIILAATTFDVGHFGAVGDGVHDDGPAIRQAIAAAVNAGPGSRVVLADKTYRLAEFQGGEFQFALSRVTGLTIEGNGARLINTPRNGLLFLDGCTNVVVRDIEVDHDPLPFTQGIIRAVDSTQQYIDLEIQQGYPLPPADEAVKRLYGPKAWEWGIVIDPVERHRRWNVKGVNFITSVKPVDGGSRCYRITMKDGSDSAIGTVRPGDRFFLPLRYGDSKTGTHSMGANWAVQGSSDCAFENINIFSGRSGLTFLIQRNEGRITLRGIKIVFKPGTDRVATTWRDGMHCPNNRVGPLIENCFFEGMMDDSINLYAGTAMAEEVVSQSEFQLTGATFHQGDAILVIDPNSGRKLADTKVKHVRREGNKQWVVLVQPAIGVVTGSKRRNLDLGATHFYNMSYCGAGYIIRNCTFGPQQRHAMLVRSPDGLIEGNVVDGVGGSGIWLANEIGSFYEGPFPFNVVIRNNVIRNPQGTGIIISTMLAGKEAQITRNIKVLNNRFTVLPNRYGIRVIQARDVVLSGNQIRNEAGDDLGAKGISISTSTNVKTR